MWPLYYHTFQQQENLEALIQTRLTGYYNNAINVRISLDGHASKIRKASRCRPTVSNETILATKQEFFFTKVAPLQSMTDIVLLGFWLILLPWMFISSYTTIYFFIKNFFFKYLCFSQYDIRMFLFVFWLRNRPSLKYVRNWGNGGAHPNCVQGEGVEKTVIRYVRTKWIAPSKCYGIFFVHWFDQIH